LRDQFPTQAVTGRGPRREFVIREHMQEITIDGADVEVKDGERLIHIINGLGCSCRVWNCECTVPGNCEEDWTFDMGRSIKTKSGSLSMAFALTLMLTASVEDAKEAIEASVRLLDRDDYVEEDLVSAVARTALASENIAGNPVREKVLAAKQLLPAELRRVMCLPRNLRLCFVLRMLAGLPRSVCANLLNLEIAQVNDQTSLAMVELANLSVRG